jgi:type III pantothenate kinase
MPMSVEQNELLFANLSRIGYKKIFNSSPQGNAMLLAVDVGNSHTVFGVYRKKNLLCHWRVRTDRQITADELAVQFHSLLLLKNITLKDVRQAIIASVAPTMQAALVSFIHDYLKIEPITVDHHLTAGMDVLIEFPSEVGADRIVNSVAARDKYGVPAVIVDFGTAITFDCVSREGHYLGGAIAPGMAIALDALSTRTAKLPRIDISRPPAAAIGTSTESAIRAGMLYGYGGMIEGLVAEIKKELAPDLPKIIATGGMAELIAPYAPSVQIIDPLLTLEGLRILHEVASAY